MGKEWIRQYRFSYIVNFILGVMFFVQSFFMPDIGSLRPKDFSGMMFFITIFIILLLNITMYFHVRKVDKTKTTADLRGYAGESIVLGFVGGLIVAVILIALIVFYVLNFG